MLRVFIWVVAVIVALPLALGLWFWYISQPTVSEKTYDLAGGEQLIVRKEIYSAYDGKTTTFVMSLRYKDGSVEEVANVDYGESEPDIPSGPFELRSDGSYYVLRYDTTFYARPYPVKISSREAWKYKGDLMDSTKLSEFARESMPDIYKKSKQKNWIWPLPKYSVERWDEAKKIVVLRQNKQRPANPTEWNFSRKDYLYQKWILQKWPRRLVFRDFQFDRQSTLALAKRERKTK